MQLSVNIRNLFGRYPFEKCAELYKDAGFTCIDYSLEEMVDDLNVFNSENWRAHAEEVRRGADRLGLRINQTHAPFTFRNWNNEDYYQTVIYPRLCRSLEISAILGAEICVMHPLHHFVYHGNEEEIFETNMRFYRGLIPLCREFNIKIGIENMWQVDPRRKFIVYDVCGTKEEFVRYIDTLDSTYMVACLDVGHVGLPMGDDEVQDFIYALGHDRLKALHIHDNDYRGDQHYLPFMGKLNWEAITKALGEIDYTGDFTYEVGVHIIAGAPDDFVPVGLRYIYDVGNYLIRKIEENRVR